MTGDDERLLARLGDAGRARNGIPSGSDVAARERAAALAGEALADLLHPDGLRTSVLGPGWSSDIDAHCATMPTADVLRDRGWVRLDGLLRRLGHEAKDQWGIVAEGEILAALDLHADPPPDPVASLLARCRRRGEVRAREVLELRALQREGHVLPRDAVVRTAARVEAFLGGDELDPYRTALAPIPTPARLPADGPLEALRRRVWRVRQRRRRHAVAISGVDGSGKSTLVASLRRSFERAGFPVAVVFTRPGMRLGWLDDLARLAKRLTGRSEQPGVYRVGAGARAEGLPERRGPVGWLWALVVTLSFLRDARRRARGGGIVIFDRHLPDALVTLDLVYAGVRLGIHRALVRRFLPRADVAFYLDVPAATALERKADDLFGEEAVRRQLALYERCLAAVPRVARVEAARPPGDVTGSVLRAILARA